MWFQARNQLVDFETGNQLHFDAQEPPGPRAKPACLRLFLRNREEALTGWFDETADRIWAAIANPDPEFVGWAKPPLGPIQFVPVQPVQIPGPTRDEFRKVILAGEAAVKLIIDLIAGIPWPGDGKLMEITSAWNEAVGEKPSVEGLPL